MADPIEDMMFEIEQEMTRRGLPQMSAEIMRAIAPELEKAEFQSGEWTPKRIVDEVQAARQQAAGGGFVNDRSGGATQQMRGQLDIPPPGQPNRLLGTD